ncbi:MAG: hypothetical protein M1840_008578 [Geoglossum simile]|nr:MAG: hypothetical protein M1840_008578 [Geoglossum simile]
MQLTRILASSSLFVGAALAVVHTVKVGDGGNKFNPDSLQASAGDVVQFVFASSSHTVVQADFAKPCSPSSGGFFSGSVKDKAFEINVTDTNPIWFYCDVQAHCNSGMVGVINPPSSGDTLKAFVEASKTATIDKASSSGPDGGIVVTPGDSSESATGSASASGSRTPVATSASASASASSGSPTGTGTVQETPASTGAAAVVTEHAGLILPVLFAAVGLAL